MGFWRIVITIILPPLVLLGKGFGWAFIINILLTLLGYIPGFDSRVLGAKPAIKPVSSSRGVNAPRSSATLSECFR